MARRAGLGRLVSFSELYIADSSRISEALRNIGQDRAALGEIAPLDPSPESAIAVAEISGRLEDALSLKQRYSSFRSEEMTTEFRGQFAELCSLERDYDKVVGSYLKALFCSWGRSSEVIESWREGTMPEIAQEARRQLDDCAEAYSTLVATDVVAGRMKEGGWKAVSGEIESYASFASEKKIVDMELDKALAQANGCESMLPPKLDGLERQLGMLEVEYKTLAKRHRSQKDRLFSRKRIFGCEERLVEIAEARARIKENKDYNAAEGGEADGRLIESWVSIYKNSLDYLGESHEITNEHVENVARLELADKSFVERTEKNSQLSKRLGGFIELDQLTRKQIERELARIKTELERRQDVLEAELGMPEYSADYQNKNNLELMLAAGEELTRMRKLTGCGIGDSLKLKAEVENRLKRCEWDGRRRTHGISGRREAGGRDETEETAPRSVEAARRGIGSRPAGYENHEWADDREGDGSSRAAERLKLDYISIVKNAEKHLDQLAGRLDGGVLGPSGVKTLFAARDSYYNSLRLMGQAAPVDEIETIIRRAYDRDKETIGRFTAANPAGNPGGTAFKRAAYFMQTLNAWEKYS